MYGWVPSLFTWNYHNTVNGLLFSCSVMFDSSWPHGLQYARFLCPLPFPRACSNSCPLSQWCHLTISSSVIPFSSCLQSFPASGSFLMSQLFTSDGPSSGPSASASDLPMSIQDWFPLGWTGWTSLQSKSLSRVFSNTDWFVLAIPPIQNRNFKVWKTKSEQNGIHKYV